VTVSLVFCGNNPTGHQLRGLFSYFRGNRFTYAIGANRKFSKLSSLKSIFRYRIVCDLDV